MITSNYDIHIEYIYPDIHFRRFWGRVVLMSLILALQILGFALVGSSIEENPAYIMILIIMGVFLPTPLVWFFFDSLALFKSPIAGYKIMGKVYINHEYIVIAVGSYEIRKLKWLDVEIIEKSRDGGEKHISIITNKMNDKLVLCSEKKRNYIQLPARQSIEDAIKRFSRKEITIKPHEINRFVINY